MFPCPDNHESLLAEAGDDAMSEPVAAHLPAADISDKREPTSDVFVMPLPLSVRPLLHSNTTSTGSAATDEKTRIGFDDGLDELAQPPLAAVLNPKMYPLANEPIPAYFRRLHRTSGLPSASSTETSSSTVRRALVQQIGQLAGSSLPDGPDGPNSPTCPALSTPTSALRILNPSLERLSRKRTMRKERKTEKSALAFNPPVSPPSKRKKTDATAEKGKDSDATNLFAKIPASRDSRGESSAAAAQDSDAGAFQSPPAPFSATSQDQEFAFDSTVADDASKSNSPSPMTATAPGHMSGGSSALPSPSLSPITAANLDMANGNSFKDSARALASSNKTLAPLFEQSPFSGASLDLAGILQAFDTLPTELQNYLVFHILRRSPLPTLQYAASIIMPTLKRDFLALLPLEMSLHILRYLDAASMCRAAQVSKRWRFVVDSDPGLWRSLIYASSFDVDKDLRNDLVARKYGLVAEHVSNERIAQMHSIPTTDSYYKDLYRKHHIMERNWRTGTASHLSFPGHGNHVVTCLQYDSDRIVSGSDDQCINVYDAATGRLRNRLQGHEGGVWALQYIGDTLVSGSTDRTVRVWDMPTGECTHVFSGHTSTVRCLQIILPQPIPGRPKGAPLEPPHPVIVTGSRDSTLRVWKMPSPYKDAPYRAPGSTSPAGNNAAAPPNPYHMWTLMGHTHSVRALAGSGSLLVSGSYDCTVRVWNIVTGQCLWRMIGHMQKVYSVVLDRERNQAMSGSMDATVRVWSLFDGSCLHVLEGHSSLVGLLELTPKFLVSAAADSTLRIWSPDEGTCLSVLSAHTGAITCFQHDAQKVVSGSDGTLKMWDIRTGKFVRDLLTNVNGVWQIRFDEKRCVAAVQRNSTTWFEVLNFEESAPAKF